MRHFLLKNKVFRAIFFSFPIRLLLLNFKKNLLFLALWALLFGFITNNIAARYGVGYLFLNPEYIDFSGVMAYLIMGFSVGGFIMAYNITSYIINAFRFPFLATLSNPFWKFCLNNFIIPVSFIITYIVQILKFQEREQTLSGFETGLIILAFLLGVSTFLSFSFLYFFRTNKDMFKMHGIRSESQIPKPSAARLEAFKKMGVRNPNLITESRDWYVETYMSGIFRWKLVRPVKHYKRAMLRSVFKQNHKNATWFQIAVIASLFILGFFNDVPLLVVPAGASIVLLFTLLLMLLGATYTFFRGWANAIMLILFLLFNFAFSWRVFDSSSKAYGLDYSIVQDYSIERINTLNSDKDVYTNDVASTLEILNQWKKKVTGGNDSIKPKMVFINTSGGGLRSALWTFYIMQFVDSASHGKLMQQTQLITGSSGGMIGASYYREMYLQSKKAGTNLCYDPIYRNNIAKDLLNPVAFSIATNDWFLPFRRVVVDGRSYNKDRSYSFEQKLNENTNYLLDNPLSYYQQPEAKSDIPMMVFTPVIINDGRKLVVAAQPVSYLTYNRDVPESRWSRISGSVEYQRLFEGSNPSSIRYTSVLRVNSTFPYIFPISELPTQPSIEVMDAGIRDNFGIETSLRFLYTFRDWIEKNTSGVIFIQMRDKKKDSPVSPNTGKTIIQNFSKPVGTFYGNHFTIQDYNHEELLHVVHTWYNGELDVVDFELKNEENDKISLSWHLTNYEKKKVYSSLGASENQESLRRLFNLLERK